jgi:hypothetical protein
VLSFVDTEENLRVVPPVPQEQVVKLARNARYLLSWTDNQVKVWQVEEIDDTLYDEDRISKRYLLEMTLNVIISQRFDADNRVRKTFQRLRSPRPENIF